VIAAIGFVEASAEFLAVLPDVRAPFSSRPRCSRRSRSYSWRWDSCAWRGPGRARGVARARREPGVGGRAGATLAKRSAIRSA
jgi:hypothetical protein